MGSTNETGAPVVQQFSEFLKSTDWGPVAGAVIGAAGGILLWFRRKRDALRQRKSRRQAVKRAQRRLPEALDGLCRGMSEINDSLGEMQTSVQTNTEALTRLAAYATGAMEASDTPQAWFDDSAKLVSCNDAMTRLAGLGRAELRDYGYHVLMSAEHIRAFMTEHEWMARHRRGREGRSRMRNGQGREVQVHFKITPAFKSPEDRIKMFLCVLREEDGGFDASNWGAFDG